MNDNGDSRDRDYFRKIGLLHKIIELLAVSQGQIPINITDLGHFVKQFDNSGFVGGYINQIFTDGFGRLHSTNIQISSLLGCGHIVSNIDQISGYCQICGRFCCNIYSDCLKVCELSGITVCRQHYKEKDGVVVSSIAQKGLWKLKARKIAKRKELENVKHSLPARK